MDQAIITADTAKIAELLALISADALSVREAATSLAGHRLKAMHEASPNRTAYDHGALYRSALVDLESRLPGWQGLSLERHFSQD